MSAYPKQGITSRLTGLTAQLVVDASVFKIYDATWISDLMEVPGAYLPDDTRQEYLAIPYV